MARESNFEFPIFEPPAVAQEEQFLLNPRARGGRIGARNLWTVTSFARHEQEE